MFWVKVFNDWFMKMVEIYLTQHNLIEQFKNIDQHNENFVAFLKAEFNSDIEKYNII